MRAEAVPIGRYSSPMAGMIAVISAVIAALVPKCPFCLAAYLSVFGVSVGAASTALPWLRPIAIALGAAALALIVLRRRARATWHQKGGQSSTQPMPRTCGSTGRD